MTGTADAISPLVQPRLSRANHTGLALLVVLGGYGVAEAVAMFRYFDAEHVEVPPGLALSYLPSVLVMIAVGMAWGTRRRGWARAAAGTQVLALTLIRGPLLIASAGMLGPQHVVDLAGRVLLTAAALFLTLRRSTADRLTADRSPADR